jgi:hypothetical protein
VRRGRRRGAGERAAGGRRKKGFCISYTPRRSSRARSLRKPLHGERRRFSALGRDTRCTPPTNSSLIIFVELQGKLAADGSNAQDRCEDLLTSTFFGAIRYLPAHEGLLPILNAARRVSLENGNLATARQTSWIPSEQVASFDIDFWPHVGEKAEPDLLVRLLDPTGLLVHLITIEVNLWSPKSGRPQVEVADADDGNPDALVAGCGQDQLVKYWQRICPLRGDTPASLIYLTAHVSPPERDLRESLESCPERIGRTNDLFHHPRAHPPCPPAVLPLGPAPGVGPPSAARPRRVCPRAPHTPRSPSPATPALSGVALRTCLVSDDILDHQRSPL